jgi:taurine dioxygenase
MKHPQARDVHPTIGAEITGVDLDADLDDTTVEFLRETFDSRGLLVFRDVEIPRVRQYVLCEVLRGREVPTAGDAAAAAARQEHFYVSNRRERATAPMGRLLFHSDGMWTDESFEVLSLHAVDVEPPVPPTTFASATAGWAMLSDEMQARLAPMHALQVGGPEDFHESRRQRFGDDVMQTVRDNAPSFTLPVSRVHPRTGQTILFLAENHTKQIIELPLDASDELLDELFVDLYGDDNVYEHHWRNGDLVVWDNLSLQHGRPNVTLDGATRTLAKIGLPIPTSAALTSVQSFELAK